MRKSSRKDKPHIAYSTIHDSIEIASPTTNDVSAFSDSEALYEPGSHHHHSRRGGAPLNSYYQVAGSLPNLSALDTMRGGRSSNGGGNDGFLTDGDDPENGDTYLDFAPSFSNAGNKIVRTGRQRKKLAARSKGGEFQTKRKKRRVYFCCISSEIELQKLLDYLNNAEDLLYDWKFELYNDVLHLYKPGVTDDGSSLPRSKRADRVSITADDPHFPSPSSTFASPPEIDPSAASTITPSIRMPYSHAKAVRFNKNGRSIGKGREGQGDNDIDDDDDDEGNTTAVEEEEKLIGGTTTAVIASNMSFDEYLKNKFLHTSPRAVPLPDEIDRHDSTQSVTPDGDLIPNSKSMLPIPLLGSSVSHRSHNKFLSYASKEVFIFDFGAAVFWGFSRGEEAGLLKTIRLFVTKGMVAVNEFEYGEDDMAFVLSPDEKTISIANDVISIPEDTLPKQRMAVSFAIAQSSVLAIFEARIEQKVEEYKYIPEALAAYGKVQLSERQLGMMIGEVFVIRHDVNLHTEILGNSLFFVINIS
jgi:uncharacterized Rmd1/YagE family protein